MKPTGMIVEIQLSDPWDLGESLEWKPLRGSIEQWPDRASHVAFVIRLDIPIDYRGEKWTHLAASPRFRGSSIDDLSRGGALECGLEGMTAIDAANFDPSKPSTWRGGLGAVATISLLRREKEKFDL